MTGLLHFGLGAFHRAHQAPFTQAANQASGQDWQIEAIAMRSPDLARALAAQGHRYTLITRHPDGPTAQEIRVIRSTHVLPENPAAIIARLADPDLHVVTITVTEKGYGLHPGTDRLDPDHPAVAADLAAPDQPSGLMGVLTAGLAARRAAGLGGLSVLSCDNLPANGQALRAGLLDFAQRVDPALARWAEQSCAFPNSMVDRITPASTPDTLQTAQRLTGHPDPVAVETEPFSQWVIQDSFAGPRPAWDQAGVQIVTDVAPYELMKLRMLNGAHSLIAYLGTCGGFAAVRDVMADADCAALVRLHMDQAAQTLPPGLETRAYADALVDRFSNPAIDHRCLQIAMDGSQKLPQRIFFAAQDRLARGQSAQSFALATALWMHHVDRSGAALSDPLAKPLRAAVSGPARGAVQAIGALPGIAETGLFARPDWIDAVCRHLDEIRNTGAQAAARRCLAAVSR